MTKFEQIGVERQENSRTMEELDRQMNHSCECCVYRGLGYYMDCDHCAIIAAHERIMKTFEEGGLFLGLG